MTPDTETAGLREPETLRAVLETGIKSLGGAHRADLARALDDLVHRALEAADNPVAPVSGEGLPEAGASLHNGIREAGVLGLSDVTITLEAAIVIRDALLADNATPPAPTTRVGGPSSEPSREPGLLSRPEWLDTIDAAVKVLSGQGRYGLVNRLNRLRAALDRADEGADTTQGDSREGLDTRKLGIAVDEASEDSAWNGDVYMVTFRIPEGTEPTDAIGAQIAAAYLAQPTTATVEPRPNCSDCFCCTAPKVFGVCLQCGMGQLCTADECPDFRATALAVTPTAATPAEEEG